ncbi:hypothetical protein FA13DRAFT_1735363 [Coprinellus micaceus]|uniref:Uncharacterized protein n=1 Tax=Coprinellus micaceus TaxID=71717 RepID=A0A4Y7T3Z8_COPMI|nr:hypothetical protein FA13DRAFT_1735363 [Coprinellus micaceus]
MPASSHASLPPFMIPLCVLVMLLSAGVFGLSIVNFGLLSRWYNAGAAILAFLFGSILIYLIRRHPKFVPPMVIVLPMSPFPTEKTPKVDRSDQESVHSTPDFHVIHHMATLMCLTFLNIIYLVAFGLMLDITIKGGAKSTLPRERAKGVTYPWNIKVQIAQTALIGVEALTLAGALVTCLIGRARIGQLQDEEQENSDYGLKSSEKCGF